MNRYSQYNEESFIDTFFDKIYVISLKSSQHRRDSITQQFKKYGILNYHIIDATDKKDLSSDDLLNSGRWKYSGICSTDCSCGGSGIHPLSFGEIALNISNYRVYCDIIDNNYEKCLIMEDDCIITDEILNFKTIINHVPENWELIYLGNSQYINRNTTQDINNDEFLKCNGVQCTHIYAVTNYAADKLSKHIFPIKAAFDGFLHRFIIQPKILKNVYISKKDFAINGSLKQQYPSEIS